MPDILSQDHSTTIKYLTGEYSIIALTEARRPVDPNVSCIEIKGCRENNLKNVDVRLPAWWNHLRDRRERLRENRRS